MEWREERRTNCAVQANGSEDIGGTALRVAVQANWADAGRTGRERSSGGAGSEGEDCVTHVDLFYFGGF